MKKLLFLLTIELLCLSLHAEVVRDTLKLDDSNKVIINYEMSVEGDVVTVIFSKAEFSGENYYRGHPTNDVKVMFFDKTQFKTIVLDKKGLKPNAMRIPSSVAYDFKQSNDFYNLRDDGNLKLKFQLNSDAADIEIPIFLALYKKPIFKIPSKGKKTEYKLFAHTQDDLRLHLQKQQVAINQPKTDISKPQKSQKLNELGYEVIQKKDVVNETIPHEEPIIGPEIPYPPSSTEGLRYRIEALKRQIDDADSQEKLVGLKNQITELGVWAENDASLKDDYNKLEKAYDDKKQDLIAKEKDEKKQELYIKIESLRLKMRNAKSTEELEGYKQEMFDLAPIVSVSYKDDTGLNAVYNELESISEEKEAALKKENVIKWILRGLLGLLAIILMFLFSYLNKKWGSKFNRELMNEAEREARGLATGEAMSTGPSQQAGGFFGRIFGRYKSNAEYSLRRKAETMAQQGTSRQDNTEPETPASEEPAKQKKTAGSTNRSRANTPTDSPNNNDKDSGSTGNVAAGRTTAKKARTNNAPPPMSHKNPKTSQTSQSSQSRRASNTTKTPISSRNPKHAGGAATATKPKRFWEFWKRNKNNNGKNNVSI